VIFLDIIGYAIKKKETTEEDKADDFQTEQDTSVITTFRAN